MNSKTIELKKLSASSIDRAAQVIKGSSRDVEWTVRFAAGTKVGTKTKSPRS